VFLTGRAQGAEDGSGRMPGRPRTGPWLALQGSLAGSVRAPGLRRASPWPVACGGVGVLATGDWSGGGRCVGVGACGVDDRWDRTSSGIFPTRIGTLYSPRL
jgi:hypothetical protein